MTKQRAIASRDHGAGIPEQGFDGMAGGGCLPVVPLERVNTKYSLRDFLLGGAGTMTVECLQHSAGSRPLLASHARVLGNGASMEGREQAANSFKPVEPLDAEGHERAERNVGRCAGGANKLKMLAAAEIVSQAGIAIAVHRNGGARYRLRISVCGKNRGWFHKCDGARIVFREPKDLRIGRGHQRVHREIAIPIAAEYCRSAGGDRLCCCSVPGNRGRRIRCDAAIPTRCRTRSCQRHAHSVPRSASRKHLVSSRSSLRS